jgi:hypothetical protein
MFSANPLQPLLNVGKPAATSRLGGMGEGASALRSRLWQQARQRPTQFQSNSQQRESLGCE